MCASAEYDILMVLFYAISKDRQLVHNFDFFYDNNVNVFIIICLFYYSHCIFFCFLVFTPANPHFNYKAQPICFLRSSTLHISLLIYLLLDMYMKVKQ